MGLVKKIIFILCCAQIHFACASPRTGIPLVETNALSRLFVNEQITFSANTFHVQQNQEVKTFNNFLDNAFPYLKRIEFDRSYRLVYFLWIAILYCIASMLILLPVILLNRNHIINKAKIDQFLRERYQETLIEYLYNTEQADKNKEQIRTVAKDKYSQQFLINEIIDISINLKGEAVEKLRDLYLDLNLHKLTFKKLNSRKWHLKIKAFREMSMMNLRGANDIIKKSLDSKNEILRMEAQIALVRLNETEPYKFLDDYEKPFSLWEQMNVHEMIVLHNIEIPAFSKWVRSPNKSVAIFALDMIRVLKQNNSFNEVTALLEDSDKDIRKAAINALGSFKEKRVLEPLKSRFYNEVYENKLAILKGLQRTTNIENIPFLINVLDREQDVEIQIEAAKAVREIGHEGQRELENLFQSDKYRNYQIILKHVLDKRI